MAGEKKTIKFQMMMSPAEAEALDSWGFGNRIRSRAETIRRLMQVALVAQERSDRIVELSEATLGNFKRFLRGMLPKNSDRYEEGDLDILLGHCLESIIELNYLSVELESVVNIAKNLPMTDQSLELVANSRVMVSNLIQELAATRDITHPGHRTITAKKDGETASDLLKRPAKRVLRGSWTRPKKSPLAGDDKV